MRPASVRAPWHPYTQPAFRDKDRRANVALYVAKQPLTPNDPMDAPTEGDAEYVELPISAHSKAPVVAGARSKASAVCALMFSLR